MSQENVEIVRTALEALNEGDFEAVFRQATPDAEFDLSRAVGIDRGVYSLAQFRALVEEFARSWESVRYGADEFIEGGENVVMPFTNSLRGRDGIEVQARGFWVWTIRDGLVVQVTLFQDRSEALEAAGLRE